MSADGASSAATRITPEATRPRQPKTATRTRSIHPLTTRSSRSANRSTRTLMRPDRSWVASSSMCSGRMRSTGRDRLQLLLEQVAHHVGVLGGQAPSAAAVASVASSKEGSITRRVPVQGDQRLRQRGHRGRDRQPVARHHRQHLGDDGRVEAAGRLHHQHADVGLERLQIGGGVGPGQVADGPGHHHAARPRSCRRRCPGGPAGWSGRAGPPPRSRAATAGPTRRP